MRKVSAVLVCLCLLGIAMTPYPLEGQAGSYNTLSGMYWCDGEAYCLHEIAHKLDQEAGWKSHSQDFRLAVNIFIFTEAKELGVSKYLYSLLNAPGVLLWNGISDPNSEMYANIFQWSGGNPENMPEIFREFYDWPRARELMEK